MRPAAHAGPRALHDKPRQRQEGPMATEYHLGEWRIRQGLRVRVQLSEHQGKPRLDIRQWYMGDEGEWCPSRRGISITPEHVGELAQMVARAEALLAGKMPQSRNGGWRPSSGLAPKRRRALFARKKALSVRHRASQRRSEVEHQCFMQESNVGPGPVQTDIC